MGIFTDRAIGHGRKHDGQLQLNLWRNLRNNISLFIHLQMTRLFTQEYFGFHGFTQRVDGWIGYLAGIDEHFIPVYRIFVWVSHGGQQNAAAVSLTINLLDGTLFPVVIFFELVVGFDNFKGACQAHTHTALAVHTAGFVCLHDIQLRVVAVHIVGALPFTDTAFDAAVWISDNFILRINIIDSHCLFSFTIHSDNDGFTALWRPDITYIRTYCADRALLTGDINHIVLFSCHHRTQLQPVVQSH